jgi:hypothetical protein
MQESCSIGTPAECITHFDALKDVGVDEFALYGSTPAQNAGLVRAWREHRRAA